MAIEQHIIADKNLIRTARVISMIFTPFSIPFMAFLILFVFSYLRIMPLQYKLIVLGVVYCFTILMPTLTIFLFRKINGFTPEDLTERKRRYVPFILTITSYVFCLLMMHRLNIPWYMTGIIFASLIVMIICVIVNLKWKLSEQKAREEGVRLARIRFEGGLTSETSYQQAQVELARTATLVPDLERKISIKENDIAFLAGEFPTRIERSRFLEELDVPESL